MARSASRCGSAKVRFSESVTFPPTLVWRPARTAPPVVVVVVSAAEVVIVAEAVIVAKVEAETVAEAVIVAKAEAEAAIGRYNRKITVPLHRYFRNQPI